MSDSVRTNGTTDLGAASAAASPGASGSRRQSDMDLTTSVPLGLVQFTNSIAPPCDGDGNTQSRENQPTTPPVRSPANDDDAQCTEDTPGALLATGTRASGDGSDVRAALDDAAAANTPHRADAENDAAASSLFDEEGTQRHHHDAAYRDPERSKPAPLTQLVDDLAAEAKDEQPAPASHGDVEDAFGMSCTAFVERDAGGEGGLLAVNDIEVFAPVGSGAYGTVYAAECPRYDGLLAVKELPRRNVEHGHDGPRSVRTFDGASFAGSVDQPPCSPDGNADATATVDLVHEADVMSRLRHENVVRIYEAIDDPAEDAVFLVMEFVDGKPAGAASCDAAKQNDTGDTSGRFSCTTLPEREQRLVARGVAAALQYCQRQKVVHGDVKPENVLLEFEPQAPAGPDGQRPPRAVARAKLADFGVAVTLQGGACRYDDVPSPSTVTGRDPWTECDESQSTQALSFLQFGASMSHDVTDGVTPTSASVLTPPQNPASASLAAQLMQGSPIRAHRQQSRAAAGSSSVIGPGPLHGIASVLTTDGTRPVLTGPAENVSGPAEASGETLGAATEISARTESLILPCDNHGHPLALATPPSRFGSPRAKKCARGTPAFLAPELVTGAAPHPTPASDAWALGVTLFGLRYGYLPFGGTSRMQLCDAIAHEDPRFPPMDAAPGSDEWRTERRWRSLLRGLLTKDPASRLTTTDVLRAALLREHDSEEK